MSATVPLEFDYRVLASGLDHAEGVCWDARRQCVWAGGEAGQLYRVSLDGSVEVVAIIEGGALLGLALDRAGDLYVCDIANHQVWRVGEDVTPRRFGESIDYPNYPAFGPDGRLYVSDSGSFFEPTGRILAIEPDGTTRDVSPRPVAYANGLAFRGSTLYVVESAMPGVSAMDITGGPLEVVVTMSRCQPDGLAFDAEGGLLISCYQPNQLWHWSEEGGLALLLDEWTGEQVLSPTNLAFYGGEFDRVVLASLCGHDLPTLRLATSGAPVQYLSEGAS